MKLKKQQKTILSVDGHIVWISIFINILTFELIKGLEIIHDLHDIHDTCIYETIMKK